MKKWIALMVLAVAASGNVSAHGNEPKHGGVVQVANELSFELVSKDGKALIYVEDHGRKKSTAGATGKLTVLNGTEKSEMALVPAGDNMLVTKGDIKLRKGAKAVASIMIHDADAVNVRFAVK